MASRREIILNLRETQSGHALLDAARDLERVADESDKFGDRTKALGREQALLQGHLDRTTTKVKDLRRQIATSGDTSLFRDLGREESNLRRFQRVLRDLAPEKDRGGILGGAEMLFGGGGGRVAGLAQWAVPIAGMLAPTIGSAVGAAVLGAAGTGGMVGGIVLAARDPRVGTAFKGLGHQLSEDLHAAAAGFVEPLVQSADVFGRAWERQRPAVRDALGELATDVKPVAEGLAGLVEHSMPGLVKGLNASSGLAHQFAQDAPDIGNAFSDMFASFAAGEPGAKRFFHDAATFTEKTLVGVGNFAEAMSKLYNSPFGRPPIMTLFDSWDAFWDKVHGRQGLAGGLTAVGRDLTKPLRDDLAKTEHAVEALEHKFRDLADAAVADKRSIIGFGDALAELSQTIGESGTKSIDLNTEAGRRNATAFLDAAEAARRQRDAMIAAGVDTATANQIMAANMAKVEAQAGRNRQAIHDFIVELERVPPVTRSQLILEFSRTGLPGEHSGQRLADLAPALAPVVRPLSHQAFIEGTRDAGGPVGAGRSYLIGGRPEILTMGSRPGYVTPTGGGTTTVSTEIRFAGDTDSAFASAFMKLCRIGQIKITSNALEP